MARSAGKTADPAPWPSGLSAETPLDDEPGAREELDPDSRALFELLQRDPRAAMDGIRRRYQWYADGWGPWATFTTDLADPDFPVGSRPEVHEACITWFGESARQGSTGLIEDALAVQVPWGFSLTKVSHQVHIWWGKRIPSAP